MFGLAIAFGCIVGFALGLTGGGGGIFAVPLLVYGLGVPPREAVGISLASVGGIALFGATPRLLRGEVEWRTGLVFAIAGMLGAPIGTWLATLIPENALLVLFALLMFVVAQRMWAKSRSAPPSTPPSPTPSKVEQDAGAPVTQVAANCTTPVNSTKSLCQRDTDGKLIFTSRCALLLALLGLATGILSGMFGVGGGFVIVPALVLFSGMPIHQAVATSLFVIVLVSISGVSSHLANGNHLSLQTAAQFLVGGFVGMWLGGLVALRLKGPTLQKTFSIAVVLVAIFVIFRSVVL